MTSFVVTSDGGMEKQNISELDDLTAAVHYTPIPKKTKFKKNENSQKVISHFTPNVYNPKKKNTGTITETSIPNLPSIDISDVKIKEETHSNSSENENEKEKLSEIQEKIEEKIIQTEQPKKQVVFEHGEDEKMMLQIYKETLGTNLSNEKFMVKLAYLIETEKRAKKIAEGRYHKEAKSNVKLTNEIK